MVPTCARQKRPQDRVNVKNLKDDFIRALPTKIRFKGFCVKEENMHKKVEFIFNNEKYDLEHGSVVIAEITSCTNTSNPEVMDAAEL